MNIEIKDSKPIEHSMDLRVLNYIEQELGTTPNANKDILEFIARMLFSSGAEDSLLSLFGGNYAYFFAVSLADSFYGSIVYSSVHKTFAMEKKGILYTIRGIIVDDDVYYVSSSTFPVGLETGRPLDTYELKFKKYLDHLGISNYADEVVRLCNLYGTCQFSTLACIVDRLH